MCNKLKGCKMEDKFFDIDEAMVDFAEMTSFNFESSSYLAVNAKKEIPAEYSRQKYTFKYGNYDLLDMFQSMFSKANAAKG